MPAPFPPPGRFVLNSNPSLPKRTPVAYLLTGVILSIIISACSSPNPEGKEEQIIIRPDAAEVQPSDTAQGNSIRDHQSLNQMATDPSSVVLTGMARHRLVTVYKSKSENKAVETATDMYSVYGRTSYESYESDREIHFMPGIDLIRGYNLLNIAHYDLVADTMNYMFEHPVLIKSLYYPSFEQDSLSNKPVNRDYYIVSVYDNDTNQDTLINKRDLRRLYYFNASCTQKIQLLPADYSVVRSQYDSMNDVMYLFARLDANHNGVAEKREPLHIFWVNLKSPDKAKRLY
jgi:hypothetical protein